MKTKQKKKKKSKSKPNYNNRISTLLYFTFIRVLIVFYCATLCSVTPIRITIAVYLMISFTIHAFEDMRTWLTIFGS